MLDCVHPWGFPLGPARAAQVVAQLATEPWQLTAYHALRRAVFVEEQRLFRGSDLDAHDASASPLVALSLIAGMADAVVGVVRIYPEPDGAWYGGRLAVTPAYRRGGAVGTALIGAAVSTARARGCRRFLATVQLQNERYFERHHFRRVAAVEICGRPHALMEAELARFPRREAAPEPALLRAA